MKVVYMAHPLGAGPDREVNRANAAKWMAWITLVHRVAVIADWITLSGELSEDHRALGLECDFALIERADEVWLVGGRVSPGMQLELDYARTLGRHINGDLLALGYAAPELPTAASGEGASR